MTRLRGLQRRPRRRRVANLAHHDHVRILPERVHKCRLRARGVGSDFALVDHCALVRVQHLDRILDRDDVTLPRAVHVVDHGGERRGLPRAGETRHEHEPMRCVGKIRDRGRQRQRLEARDAGQHATQDETHPTTLAERAHAEAPESGDGVHEVGFVGGTELGHARVRHDRDDARFGVGRFDGVEGRLTQAPVDAQARTCTHLHVYVGGTLLDGETQQSVEIQHVTAGIDRSARRLKGGLRLAWHVPVRQQTLRFGDAWARLGPWRGGGRIAHLVVAPDAPLSGDAVRACVKRARAAGYEEVLTSAMGPAEEEPFVQGALHGPRALASPDPRDRRRAPGGGSTRDQGHSPRPRGRARARRPRVRHLLATRRARPARRAATRHRCTSFA